MKKWYIVNVFSGYENQVKTDLEQRIKTTGMENQIFQVLVPTEDVVELHGGKRKTVNRKFFPGYILVEMEMNDNSWYVVRNTSKVTGFVGAGNKPIPLSEEEVENILGQLAGTRPRPRPSAEFKPGDNVKVVDGPFNNFIGSVDEVHAEKTKLKVMVSIFGRPTPVELDFLQVEKM